MFADMKISDFIETLSSKEATPGGGTVSALSGALAASLLQMALGITYKNLEDDKDGLFSELQPIKKNLVSLMDSDSVAFTGVMAAYAFPKETDDEKKERTFAIQESLKMATKVPLDTAGLCIELIRLCSKVAAVSKKSCFSDVASALHAAKTGFRGALYNVAINLASIKDEKFASDIRDEAKSLKDWYDQNIGEIEQVFDERLSL